MSALVLLLTIGLWFGLGWLIWRSIISHRVSGTTVRIPLGIVLAGIWLVAPWGDEWLGAREFKRLCHEMPEVKFYGPVAVGAGAFYDSQGQRRLWAYREVLDGKSPFPNGDFKLASVEGRKFDNAWELEFKRATLSQRIQNWPIPVSEEVTTYVHAATGKLVREDRWLGSPGGWIKRLSGWGDHAPYSCAKQGTSYPNEVWIKFN